MTALELTAVSVTFGGERGRRSVPALVGLDLRIEPGERVAVVGRSGAGKSTIARLACGLVRPTAGTVRVLGIDIDAVSRRERRRLRRRVQLVFQDPYDSLHPGMRVVDLVGEPLAIAGVPRAERRSRVTTALQDIGLTPPDRFLERHPGTLSGGQRQRVALARTLVAGPELILADEPASMLDASLRVSVTDRLLAVQAQLDAALVFITHDLALARVVADRLVVLANGRLVEDGPMEGVITDPDHDETATLLDAVRSRSNPTSRVRAEPKGAPWDAEN